MQFVLEYRPYSFALYCMQQRCSSVVLWRENSLMLFW